MAARNNFDLRCAQEVFRLNRDAGEPEAAPRSAQPVAVVRRRAGVDVRVTPIPMSIRVQNARSLLCHD